jgi:type VI secretion system secreted protein VgrG
VIEQLNEAFERAVMYVLQNEGGFVNDPLDSGGATNMGVTQDTVSRWQNAPATIEDVKTLSLAEIKDIYFFEYYKPLGCEQLSKSSVTTCILDTGVLYGLVIAARLAQQAVNSCGGTLIDVDGHIGPQSVAALNNVNEHAFVCAYHAHVLARIEEIIARYPKNERFRNGWTNRAIRLLTLVK